jgi:NADPH:quinone reductase-like Zn-dependent oxidoreductase
MSAVTQDRYGSTAVLTNREIAGPNISDTQVLIRMRAAGVNMREMLSPSDVQMDR